MPKSHQLNNMKITKKDYNKKHVKDIKVCLKQRKKR